MFLLLEDNQRYEAIELKSTRDIVHEDKTDNIDTTPNVVYGMM